MWTGPPNRKKHDGYWDYKLNHLVRFHRYQWECKLSYYTYWNNLIQVNTSLYLPNLCNTPSPNMYSITMGFLRISFPYVTSKSFSTMYEIWNEHIKNISTFLNHEILYLWIFETVQEIISLNAKILGIFVKMWISKAPLHINLFSYQSLGHHLYLPLGISSLFQLPH